MLFETVNAFSFAMWIIIFSEKWHNFWMHWPILVILASLQKKSLEKEKKGESDQGFNSRDDCSITPSPLFEGKKNVSNIFHKMVYSYKISNFGWKKRKFWIRPGFCSDFSQDLDQKYCLTRTPDQCVWLPFLGRIVWTNTSQNVCTYWPKM